MVLRYKKGPGNPVGNDYIVTLIPNGNDFLASWNYLRSEGRSNYSDVPVLRTTFLRYLADRIWVPLYPTTLNLPSGA